MKFLFFKMLVVWRRFRHGMQARYMNRQDVGRQLDVLMRRIEPTSSWHERANWMIDVGEWLRHRPKVSLMDTQRWHRVRRYRLEFLLDWLDQHRDVKRTVQNALQKTLREVGGHELFSTTGLPHEPGFFGELGERLARMILPRHLSPTDLSSLFTAMFPDPDDAEWLLQLDNETMSRLWKLLADDGISHMYWQQIEEAMTYLTTTIVADGISPAFRQRLEPKMPLRATPFLALRREMDTYLRGSPHDQGTVRSVRMLVAVCHAQTDRIYEHLDEYGVSVSLVYRIERMRAHLARIGRLIELRSAVPTEGGAGRGQLLLADLISAHHNRSSVRGLMRRSFSLLARKMVERNADHGEHYIARDAAGYRAVMKAAAWGGVVVSAIVLAKVVGARWGNVHLGQFFEGLLASTGYVAGFLLIAAIGGVLATRQPAITAPALASRMGDIASTDGLRALLNEAAQLLRSQSAGIFGNVLIVVPLVGAIGAGVWIGSGTPLMTPEQARASIAGLSLVGPTPLYAALTGVLLWMSSLAAGFVDNWFALRRVHEVIANQRRLVHTLGQMRAERVAAWMERNIAVIAGNVSLGILLGMAPVLANFFSLPFDIRHVALSAGALAAAVSSLGWPTLMTPEFWLAAGGVALTGLLSVGVAFSCALALALRARDVPRRMRRFVLRAVLRRFTLAPGFFLFPDRHAEKINAATHKRTAAVDALPKAKRQERPRNQPAELVDDD